jgi:hypothetical protein
LLDLAEDDNVAIVGIQLREKLPENSEFARTASKAVRVSFGALGSTIDKVAVAAAPAKTPKRAVDRVAAAPAARFADRAHREGVRRLVERQLVAGHPAIDDHFFPRVETAA